MQVRTLSLNYCVIEWHITLFGPAEICALGNVSMKVEIICLLMQTVIGNCAFFSLI